VLRSICRGGVCVVVNERSILSFTLANTRDIGCHMLAAVNKPH
jgi:hypothetical protein